MFGSTLQMRVGWSFAACEVCVTMLLLLVLCADLLQLFLSGSHLDIFRRVVLCSGAAFLDVLMYQLSLGYTAVQV